MANTTTMDQPNGFDNAPEDTITKVKSALSETAEKTQEKAGEIGRAVQDKINQNRGPAADTLHSAASKLHQTAESIPGGEKVTSLAHSTADKMEATAAYVREHDVKDMMADLETFVRRHPGQSLMAAAGVGFLLGRALRSND